MSTKKEEQKQDSRSSGTTNPQEAKSRKDATTIAKKLETLVNEKEGKKYSVDQQSHGMIKALDEIKENIRQGINEAKAEIPRFIQMVSGDSHRVYQSNFGCVHRITKTGYKPFAIGMDSESSRCIRIDLELLDTPANYK